LTTSVLAQELPTPEESFEVEPPFLVRPDEPEPDQSATRPEELPITREKLKKQLERAKESAASAERFVKMGVLARTEAEQRALRAVGLEAELANAESAAAKEQVEAGKKRLEAGEISKGELDALAVSLARANAAAQAANGAYRQAQLDAAALNLRRQKQLLAVGSARKSDVARAEEKLATLERGEEKER
jgi:Ni,Fe-hydrogenase III large subunit